MTRIVHATDVFYPSVGGLERSVHALALRQQAEGHEVVVVTPAVAGYPSVERHEGIEIRRFPQLIARLPIHESSLRPHCPPFSDPTLSRSVGHYFSSWRPDIVHSHGLIALSIIAPAHRVNAAVVAGVHDYSFVCIKKSLLRKDSICPGPRLNWCIPCSFEALGLKGPAGTIALFVAGGKLRRADARIAVSTAVGVHGSAPQRSRSGVVQVVPTFIDDSVIDHAASAPPPTWVPKGRYILYAGALVRAKGVGVLLSAFAKVRSLMPDVQLVVAALSHPSEDETVGGDGVILVRDVAHDEILGAWRAATLGVHPAVWGEPCSLAVIECLASGTPMIATNVGGNPDLLDEGRAGVLVPPNDATALSAAITDLLEDAERRLVLGQAGQIHAQKYCLTEVMAALDGIYELALSRERGNGTSD
jgi:glycosyltransferase involved in cell wall biosynthesis